MPNFTCELSRARSRADIAELINLVELYHRWNQEGCTDQFLWDHDELDEYFRLDSDPDRALAFVILAAAAYDDPIFLGLVAAGPLEEILRSRDEELIDRIIAEACKTARFRWMLSGVYLHAISSEAASKVAAVIGSVNMDTDPLPTRPRV